MRHEIVNSLQDLYSWRHASFMWNQVKLGILEVKIFFMAEERGVESRERERYQQGIIPLRGFGPLIFFYELSRHAFY